MQSSSRYSSLFLSLTLILTLSSLPVFSQPSGDGSPDSGGSMSGRIRRHMNNDPETEGGGQGMGMNRRQQMRQKLMQMPPEQRQMFLQRMQERRQGGMPMQNWQPIERGPGNPGNLESPPGMEMEPGMGQEGMGQEGMGPGGMRQGGMRPGGMRQGGMRQGGMRPGAMRQGGMRQGFGGLHRGPLDLSQLNLTEKQKSSILTLRSKHSEQAKSLQRTLRGKRMEMRNMLFAPDLNKKVLMEKRNEVRGLQNQLDDIMMDDFLGIRSVLSEEQIKKLSQTNLDLPQKRKSAEAQPKFPGPGPNTNPGPEPDMQ